MSDQGSPSKVSRKSGGKAGKSSNTGQNKRHGKSRDSGKGIPKGRTDRTISTMSLSDDPSTFNSLLSPHVKEMLIKFKKSHAIKDPFSKDNQGVRVLS